MNCVSVFPALAACLVWLCVACESSTPSSSAAVSSTSIGALPQARMASYRTAEADYYEVKAQFLDFESGDSDHFLFEDKHGKIWDFAQVAHQEQLNLKQALPPNLHNDLNRGWSGNDQLRGKWFLLTCKSEHRPLYEGGPAGEVPVVTEAVLLF